MSLAQLFLDHVFRPMAQQRQNMAQQPMQQPGGVLNGSLAGLMARGMFQHQQQPMQPQAPQQPSNLAGLMMRFRR